MRKSRRVNHPLQLGDLCFELFQAASTRLINLTLALRSDCVEILGTDAQKLEVDGAMVARQGPAAAKEPVEGPCR